MHGQANLVQCTFDGRPLAGTCQGQRLLNEPYALREPCVFRLQTVDVTDLGSGAAIQSTGLVGVIFTIPPLGFVDLR
jgi:hypothetical protein